MVPKSLQYVWEFETAFYGVEWVHSDLLNLDDNVTFNIALRANDEETIDVRLRKTNVKLANTIIKIQAGDFMEEQEFQWEETCVFEGLIRKPEDFIIFESGEVKLFGIKVFCVITWEGFNEVEEKIPREFFTNLEKHFCFSQVFSDAILVVEDVEIPVHKVVLATFSPVFLNLFPANENPLPGESNIVEVTEVSVDAVLEMVRFFYSGWTKASQDVDVALEMYELALRFQITDLIKICEETLTTHLNIDNIVKIVQVLDLNVSEELREKSSEFLSENMEKIFKLPDYKEMFVAKAEFLYEAILKKIMSEQEFQTKYV